ncbi:hypothetical protein [Microcoleus sp. LEGE 07076]|uniref:hypothetical protein n=1 Tax=Microcoleus sp. LEGE 07076 TaxID=915322 RepID=UPI00187E46EE|nr:hypothetical protein [Microcoleus sp. LEGE 07076]
MNRFDRPLYTSLPSRPLRLRGSFQKIPCAFFKQICRLTGFPNCCGVASGDSAVRYTLPTLDSRISIAQNRLKRPVSKLSTQRPWSTVCSRCDRPTGNTAQNACITRLSGQ